MKIKKFIIVLDDNKEVIFLDKLSSIEHITNLALREVQFNYRIEMREL